MQMRRLNQAVICGLFLMLAAIVASPTQSRALTSNQAGLVIEFGDGSLYTGCTSFEAENISGYDLLASSGLSLETAIDPSQGVAVCKIGSFGCPSDDCFCQMPEYWSYWNWVNGNWSYAGSGSSLNRVGNADIDGWSWGTGDPPPAVPFNQLCAPPPPPPPTQTSAPSATQTPEPQPSDTPQPEATDTFIPPTYTNVPSQTLPPGSATPRSDTSSMITATLSPTLKSQVIERTVAVTPSYTKTSSVVVNINAPLSTHTQTPTANPVLEVVNQTKAEDRSMVGYAIFGALLVGLGLTLTRIILKGQRP